MVWVNWIHIILDEIRSAGHVLYGDTLTSGAWRRGNCQASMPREAAEAWLLLLVKNAAILQEKEQLFRSLGQPEPAG